MCGLVGYAGPGGTDAEKAFLQLLQIDVIRGPHSTGAAFVTSPSDVNVYKAVGTPEDLFMTAPFIEQMKRMNRVMIGHNRWATIGKVNKANAHPFICEHITGAHNGTLQGVHRFDEHRDFAVDSEAAFNHLAHNGVDDTWGNLGGAAAMVWWDAKEKTLNFLRNKERPLWYTLVNEGTEVFWASEDWMLDGILYRNDYKVEDLVEVKVDTLYTFNVPLAAPKGQQAIKTEERKVTPFTPPVTYVQKKIGKLSGKLGTPGVAGKAEDKRGIPSQTGFLEPIDRNKDYFVIPKKVAIYTKNDKSQQQYVEGVFCGREDIAFRIKVVRGQHDNLVAACSPTNKLGFRAKFPVKFMAGDGSKYYEARPDDVSVVPDVIAAYNKRVSRFQARTIGAQSKAVEKGEETKEKREEAGEETKTEREGYNGQMITKKEFDARYSNCGVCDATLEFDDAQMIFFDYDTGVCGKCNEEGAIVVLDTYKERNVK